MTPPFDLRMLRLPRMRMRLLYMIVMRQPCYAGGIGAPVLAAFNLQAWLVLLFMVGQSP